MGILEILLIATPGIPALLALFWPVARLRGFLRTVAPWAAFPGLIMAFNPGAEGVGVAAPALFTGMNLMLDGTGRIFLLLTALLWVVAGAFARSYHADDPRRDGFFGFFVLTMTGNLGLTVAGDILSFYLFFALMTFAAYGLVAHRRDGEARRAGRIYIVMAILGELGLLAAVLALGSAVGGVPLFGSEMAGAWSVLREMGGETGVAALVVVGFGVKAGIVPLHLWLPLAHPVAPTAASALLSGVMIEAGVLAWIRYLPSGLALPGVGTVLAILGAVSIFYGVILGLAQDDPKTVLAYSSVSQMGYMALGTGLLLQGAGWAPVGLLAVVFFAVHHGMAKGALFLAVGVADRTPGGAASRWAALMLGMAALPALVLAGAPATTGAMAKTALKSGLEELAPAWYAFLDPVLLVASAGTTLLMARFLAVLRFRLHHGDRGAGEGAKGESREAGRAPGGLLAPWILLVAASVGGGFWLPEVVTGAVEGAGVGSLQPWEEIGAAIGPLLAGAATAWVVWRHGGALGRLTDVRLPAGDLVVLFESLARRLRRLPWGVLEEEPGSGVFQAVHRAQLWVHTRAAWAARRDLHLVRGPVFGLVLAALAAALTLALF